MGIPVVPPEIWAVSRLTPVRVGGGGAVSSSDEESPGHWAVGLVPTYPP